MTHHNDRLTYPLINSIFGYWVPPGERGRALAVSNIGAGLGAISSLALAPVVSARHGWATVLYGSGWVGESESLTDETTHTTPAGIQ